MKNYFLFLLLLMSGGVKAISCSQYCGGTITTTISKNFSQGENNVNYEVGLSVVSINNTKVNMDRGTASEVFQYFYESMPGSNEMATQWSFRKADDYISVALRIKDPCYPTPIYAPFNIVSLVENRSCKPYSYAQNMTVTMSQSFESRIRIDKKLVSGSYTKNIPIGYWKLCQLTGCVTLKNVYLNLNIIVKESCVLNAGQIVDIDFGKIPVSAFRRAGEKAVGVSPAVRTIKIVCTSIDPRTRLSLRVQADKTSGNAIVSNDNNVGFVVSGSDEKELKPNDMYSIIPFPLGDNKESDVIIKVFPVSVTGNLPKEGVVTSAGYLRLDFD